MYKGKTVISIIPARGGSKSVPRKNIQMVGGKPLVAWSILDSVSSKYVDRTIVSTEDGEIARISNDYGATVIPRPQELAQDNTQTEPVMLQVLDTIKMAEYDREDGLQRPDYVVLLEPTGIFRRKTDIDNAIKKIVDEGADSLVSVYENDVFYWEDDVDPINGRHIVKALNYDFTNRPRRQEKDWEWIENDALFITKTELLQREKCRLGDSIVLYEMPKFISCEIDTVWDLKIANWLIQQKEVLGELQK